MTKTCRGRVRLPSGELNGVLGSLEEGLSRRPHRGEDPLDAADALFELADKYAVAEYKGVIMGQRLPQSGEVVEPVVVRGEPTTVRATSDKS